MRRTLVGIAVVAAVAAGVWATATGLAPASQEPSPPAPASAVAPLALNLPPAAPAPGAAPSAVAGSAPPAPVQPPTPPRVGSEGYGPHIERAQAGTDAKAAWEAVQWLRLRATNEARRSSFETVRNQGVSPEMMTQLMVESDAEARRCQTVTDLHRSMQAELAARAMRAGVPEAASVYASAMVPADLTPTQRSEVAADMRRDARTGDLPSLLGALVANPAWGLDDAERLAYLYAYGTLGGPHGEAVAKGLLQQHLIALQSVPTPAQLAATKAAGQEIVARAGRKP